MGLIKKGLITLVVALVGQHIFRLVRIMGYHKTIYNHEPGPCHLVPGMVNGSEDLQVLSSGIAVISSGVKIGEMWNNPDLVFREGALYMFDFNNPDEGVTKLKVQDTMIVGPHGLGIWEDKKTGKVTLFVINHLRSGDRVEKFEFDQINRQLHHQRTILDHSFVILNDLTPTGPDSFYATNSMGTMNEFTQRLEFLLLLRLGSVIYYDGTRGSRVLDRLACPNGINQSPDGRYVYVSSVGDEAINIYRRQPDNSLKLTEEVILNTFPDNIDVRPDTGEIWVAAQPVAWRFIRSMQNVTQSSPSQVLRLKVNDGHVTNIEEVYADDGKMLYASSVAVYHEGVMLIGSVHHGLLYCQIRHLS